MEILNIVFQILILLILLFAYLFLKKYWPAYFKEKGKNLATKEDISEITNKIESVKSIYERSILKFDYFHREQAKVLGQIYSLLVDAVDSMYDLTVPIRWSDGKTIQQRMEEANKKVFDLQEYYKRNRIYLNKEIKTKIEAILKEMFESYTDYNLSQMEGLERKEKSEQIEKAFEKIEKKTLPIYDEIEELFRKILNDEK